MGRVRPQLFVVFALLGAAGPVTPRPARAHPKVRKAMAQASGHKKYRTKRGHYISG